LVFHALERGTRLIVSGAGAAQPGSLALVLDVAVDDLVDDDLDDFAGLLAQLAPFVDGLSEEARRNRAEAQLLAENHYFRERQRRHYLFKELVAESVSMRACYLSLSRFVETDEPVLIRGEAGTGKELIARAIHHLGHRSAGLMVAQNCDEIDEALLDAELFGAAKGTLGEARLGILELADGGTVYLGEVDRLSLLLQGKLLRVIKEGEIRRHGEELARAVNVRLVLSTHRPLGDLVAAGAFRKDLLVGLDSVLDVPPLRDRRGDIIPLTELFLGIFSKRYGVVEPKLSPSLAEALRAYEWRGNVRELQTAVEAAVLKSAGRELRVEDFGF
jgi:transcriptional regulator with GAF, ATPase, and Fis domain